MSKVQIIDAIMGSGKTYDAINRMKKHKGNFVYVTPFLDEVERIIKNVPGVYQPKVNSYIDPVTGDKIVNYKRDNLLTMANGGVNMATTHSLFQKLKRSDYKYFVNYDLILDEVITPIKVIDMKSDDIMIAFEQGLIVENKQTGEITYTGDEYNGKFYAQLKRYCDTANVVFVNGRLLVWAFPPEIFKNFKSITVLTYLFESSLLAAYFRYYSIIYQVKRKPASTELAKKLQIKQLLTIYEGAANNIGDKPTAFSVNWLRNKTKTSKDAKEISKKVENQIKRNFKTKSTENAYTTFKEFKIKLKGKGYTSGFISVNERATNQYANKKTMIYLANRYLNPNIIDYFRSGGIMVDEEQWALAELIQWVWRGAIRNNKPMNLYIPSKRMREMLKYWLDDTGTSSTLQKAA